MATDPTPQQNRAAARQAAQDLRTGLRMALDAERRLRALSVTPGAPDLHLEDRHFALLAEMSEDHRARLAPFADGTN